MSDSNEKETDRPLQESQEEPSPATVAFVTTEHYTLQSAQAATISETNGRTALFLSSVSAGLIALAFIGQVSRLGKAFFIFGIVVLGSLFIVGVFTFERSVQSSIESVSYAQRIARIRRYYLQTRPGLTGWLATPLGETSAGVMKELRIGNLWWQSFVATAGTLAVVNSMLLAATTGLLIGLLSGVLVVSAGVAGAVALLALAAHWLRQRTLWRRFDRSG